LFWFHDRDLFPRVVTKIFREPQIPKREFENLTQVYRCAPKLIPRPWHFGLLGEFWTLWMEGVPGSCFGSQNSNSPADLRAIVEVLGLLHGSFRKGKGMPDPVRFRRVVSDPLQTLARFGASASVQEGCCRMIERSPADWVNSLPVIPQHGDFVLSNVLLHRGQWHVVDWDGFGMTDIPFYDLITLLYSLLLLRGETPEHWDPLVAKQVPALIQCYAQRLALSSENLSQLLPLTLANWFYLKWSDGCQRFAVRMYDTIQHYFEHQDLWEKIFLSA
jgi:Ser/Thr protein kinase RdoA (MazF antagonist)